MTLIAEPPTTYMRHPIQCVITASQSFLKEQVEDMIETMETEKISEKEEEEVEEAATLIV